jgi:hypothetical protein
MQSILEVNLHLLANIIKTTQQSKIIPSGLLGSAGKILDSWINRESITPGRVVAPRSIPDDAPGLEHTNITVMICFSLACALIKPHAAQTR